MSKGETFDYSYILIWTTTDPSATPPTELVEYNRTQLIQFKITDVSGSVLSVDFVRKFQNGTQTTQSGTINIETGQITLPYGFLIIGSNLAKNQQVYPNGGHQIIADTIKRSYPTGERDTNLIGGEDTTTKTTIYFDKIKGIAVDYTYTIYSSSNGHVVNSTERMVNTNSAVWIAAPPPPTPGPTSQRTATPTQSAFPTVKATPISTPQIDNLIPIVVLAVVIVIVAVAVLLLVKGRGRRRKSRVDEEFAEYLKPKKP
ncbi:MAG: hypothetical protein NWE96_11885 [Candidatus Bathyarchaeota archaeon]|nr:hypothetical protein [Candidatus Bathyarchaeota archaeon]